MFRNSQNQEIRIQYVFFGFALKNTTLTESDEGSLEWVRLDEVTNRNVSQISKEIIDHYNDIGSSNEKIYVGSMKSLNGKPAITWVVLQDWEELRYENLFT